jgi:hypothetical protein
LFTFCTNSTFHSHTLLPTSLCVLSLSHSIYLSIYLSLSLTHTHTHILTLSLTLSHTLPSYFPSLSLSLPLFEAEKCVHKDFLLLLFLFIDTAGLSFACMYFPRGLSLNSQHTYFMGCCLSRKREQWRKKICQRLFFQASENYFLPNVRRSKGLKPLPEKLYLFSKIKNFHPIPRRDSIS